MAQKWTPERRAKFKATVASRKNGPGRKQAVVGLPPELDRQLEQFYRTKILAELMRGGK